MGGFIISSAFDLGPDIRDQLASVSTATITSQLLRHGLRRTFILGAAPCNPNNARLVGPAYTLRFIPMREDLSQPGSVADPNNPQRAAIEQTPTGHVLVIDTGGEPSCGCLGDILAARLVQRGVAGVVSDGAMRDRQALSEMKLPIFCAGFASPPSFNGMLPADVGCPIGCGGVAVFPGDIIVGDQDGAVVIPRHLAAEIARESVEKERLDRFGRLRVDRGHAIAGLYPPNEATMADYRRWVEAGEDDSIL